MVNIILLIQLSWMLFDEQIYAFWAQHSALWLAPKRLRNDQEENCGREKWIFYFCSDNCSRILGLDFEEEGGAEETEIRSDKMF